jgi:hypothetical protein
VNDIPELVTRQPTGKPSWPTILLAGGEKSGKSWSAAAFSSSDLIGRTFYIEIGEHYADEYGAIPGARYEIVQHDGTYRGIARAVWAATKQERVDGKPNCIVIDSATILWDMLSDQAQRTANARWRKNNPNAPEPDDEVKVTVDLWNTAKDKFGDIIRMLYQFDGPVIITARLELVTVMVGGKPTTDKTWKVRSEKNLPFEVDAVIQAREPRSWQVTGLRSTRLELPVGKTLPLPNFTVDGFLRKLGLAEEGATAPRSVTLPRPDAPPKPAADGRFYQLTPEQEHQLLLMKRDLAILIGKKLGPEAARNRHQVMSRRFKRLVGSFDDLSVIELRTALRELDAMPDAKPPRDEARYRELREQLANAELEGIDAVLHAVVDAHADGRITDNDMKELDEAASLRASALVASMAAEEPEGVPA